MRLVPRRMSFKSRRKLAKTCAFWYRHAQSGSLCISVPPWEALLLCAFPPLRETLAPSPVPLATAQIAAFCGPPCLQ
jgi:hypothetical protein